VKKLTDEFEGGKMATQISVLLPQNPDEAFNCSGAPTANSSSAESGGVEKRREWRYPACDPVDLCLLDRDNLRLSGTLRDISKNGLRIELETPLKAGERMEVLLQGRAIIFAAVRYCRRTGDFYHVGGVIDDVYYPKAAVPLRTRITAASKVIVNPVTQRTASEDKQLADSPERLDSDRGRKGLFDRVVSFIVSSKTQRLATHVDRNDIDNLLGLRLPETEAILLERHMESCDECLDLLLRTLEERGSSSSLPLKKISRAQV
jgi:hypothetical protein